MHKAEINRFLTKALVNNEQTKRNLQHLSSNHYYPAKDKDTLNKISLIMGMLSECTEMITKLQENLNE